MSKTENRGRINPQIEQTEQNLLYKGCLCQHIYFSMKKEEKPFSLHLKISERQLQQLIQIQRGLKEDVGIHKSLVDIAGRALNLALCETLRTCCREGV